MQVVVQATKLHVIVQEEIPGGRHGVATQTDDIPVLDVAQRLQLRLEFVNVLWVVVEQLLNGNGVAVFESASVHRTRAAATDHIFLAQILRQPHHLLKRLRCHSQVKGHERRRS